MNIKPSNKLQQKEEENEFKNLIKRFCKAFINDVPHLLLVNIILQEGALEQQEFHNKDNPRTERKFIQNALIDEKTLKANLDTLKNLRLLSDYQPTKIEGMQKQSQSKVYWGINEDFYEDVETIVQEILRDLGKSKQDWNANYLKCVSCDKKYTDGDIHLYNIKNNQCVKCKKTLEKVQPKDDNEVQKWNKFEAFLNELKQICTKMKNGDVFKDIPDKYKPKYPEDKMKEEGKKQEQLLLQQQKKNNYYPLNKLDSENLEFFQKYMDKQYSQNKQDLVSQPGSNNITQNQEREEFEKELLKKNIEKVRNCFGENGLQEKSNSFDQLLKKDFNQDDKLKQFQKYMHARKQRKLNN